MEEKITNDSSSFNHTDAIRKEIEAFIEKKIEESDTYSGQLSTVLRQTAFAEGVLFWFCKTEFSLSMSLISAGWFFLLLYFVFDAAQYFGGYRHARGQVDQYLKDFKNGNRDLNHYLNQAIPHNAISMFKWKIIMIIISSFILIYCFLIGIFHRC